MSEETYMNTLEKESIPEGKKEAALPKIIAVDFDGTLVTNQFPEIGEIRHPMWDAIKAEQERGTKLILFTCRTGEFLTQAVDFCREHGLVFDAINDNIDEVKALGWDARKVSATFYVDDRSAYLSFFGFTTNPLEIL